MKAAICTKYGPPDVIQIQEIAKPSIQDNEVLIKLHAATVTPGDCVIRSSKMLLMRLFFGIRKPRKQILGSELSGTIEEAGSNVMKFKKGDEVFAYKGMKLGAHAAYITLPEHGVLAIKPASITHEEAAAIAFGGTTALYFLRKGNVRKGMSVLINGASGSVGSTAVQLAKHFGAEVTAVCGSSNMDWVEALGADHVIDYTKEDFTKSGKRYDLIFDAVGKSSKSASKAALTESGTFISVKSGLASENLKDLLLLKQLVESGLFKPVIDKSYPFEQIADAHAYVEQGHKKGNVVITFN
ncbi:NAD(P)-dependent alcohol dehydrogenase [Paenibacillus radicis (ex Gao et al. 2016)]|uniref:NADPH:quinone reductase n=1 Tax=Paenibacillus radicis (ex Gao et al. 2016) TaxID=1737354 RepID=A0A917GWJ6_9BACL|nr:NAD(P)-dependent alcohol dehydrogenase [Paenibacillus radicis (ex Gao et al. 2016)]GGG59484.1 NADPH:quinone reductase [Paenibacillus radicis (ex Gao et al. 2016)]